MSKSRNIYRKRGTGGFQNTGHMRIQTGGRRALVHVLKAEAALGKPLSPKAHVHHVNNDPGDNETPWNLVVCPDAAYHKLLHVRTAALDACGHADWRKCRFCKVYDAIDNMRQLSPVHGIPRLIFEHVECAKHWWNDYYRRRQAKKVSA